MTAELAEPIATTAGELVELLKQLPPNQPICWSAECGHDPNGYQFHPDEPRPLLHYEVVLTDCSNYDSCDQTPGIMVEVKEEDECTEFTILRLQAVCEYSDDPEIKYMIWKDGSNQKILQQGD